MYKILVDRSKIHIIEAKFLVEGYKIGKEDSIIFVDPKSIRNRERFFSLLKDLNLQDKIKFLESVPEDLVTYRITDFYPTEIRSIRHFSTLEV
jgi:hypothetical protein